MPEIFLYVAIALWAVLRYAYFRNKGRTEVYAEKDQGSFDGYDKVLTVRIPYYSHLSAEGKERFVSRMVEVMKEVPVRGRDGFEISGEVRILLAGCITQLTFGFSNPSMPFLQGVAVYPEAFYSRFLRAWVKGLALGNGVVCISWKDFVEGYADSSDTYNLGLHEFGHILRFQALETSLFDARLSSYFEQWEELGTPVFMRTQNRSENFFREYGGTNKVEFFSVCIENFFEVPDKFEQELPELYYHLCYLMKQNPLNKGEDYAFDTEDIREANTKGIEHVPVYELWNSEREFNLWGNSEGFIMGCLIISVVAFLMMSVESRIITLRLLFVCLSIFMIVRWAYYSDYKAVANRYYIRHVAFKIVPVIGILALLFKAIFI
jgi:Mlc titration factor MtfA (ptsG expression regulator)